MNKGFDSYILLEQIGTDGKPVTFSREWHLRRDLSYYVQDEKLRRVLTALFEVVTPDLVCLLSYDSTDHKLTVHEGTQTDLASIPRILWSILAPTDILRAAVFHDEFYSWIRLLRSQKIISFISAYKLRKLADDIFREAMQYSDPPVKKWKQNAAYIAVRLLGGFVTKGKIKI